MDGINVEVSMNPNDQCISCTRSKLYQTEQLTVLATAQTTRVALVKAKHLRTKLTRQLMKFAWRTETIVLPDQRVAITEAVSYTHLTLPTKRIV